MDEKTRGRILRINPYSDTSLIVQWLTAEHGLISTLARGARGRKSPFAGRLDLFYLAEISFQRSKRTLHYLKEVSLTNPVSWLRKDLKQLSQASYVANLIMNTVESDAPLPEIFELFEEFMSALEHPCVVPAMLLMEIKYLDALGIGPAYSNVQPGTGKIISLLRTRPFRELSVLRISPEQLREIISTLGAALLNEFERTARGRNSALNLLGVL